MGKDEMMVLLSPSSREARAGATVALVTEDIYSVMTEHETLGFVHKVGVVYVALSGDVLSHAVEIGQTLSWDRAVHMVRYQ
jgi:hypothetical protein